MTVNLRIEHRGGPYKVQITHQTVNSDGTVSDAQTNVLSQYGDEALVALWKDKSLIIRELENTNDENGSPAG